MKTKSKHTKRATGTAHEYVLIPQFFTKYYSHGDFYGVMVSLRPIFPLQNVVNAEREKQDTKD